MSALDTISRIKSAHDHLEPDAQEVLALIAERLVKGRKVYGDLVLDKDERDHPHEALEEAADGLVYVAAALVKAEREADRRFGQPHYGHYGLPSDELAGIVGHGAG